jgi:hypothetical protein
MTKFLSFFLFSLLLQGCAVQLTVGGKAGSVSGPVFARTIDTICGGSSSYQRYGNGRAGNSSSHCYQVYALGDKVCTQQTDRQSSWQNYKGKRNDGSASYSSWSAPNCRPMTPEEREKYLPKKEGAALSGNRNGIASAVPFFHCMLH